MQLVVTVAGPSTKTTEDLSRVPLCADLVELRLDLLPVGAPADVASWIRASPRSVLATVRSTAEGGAFSGGPEAAAALLLAAAEAGAPWIDAEAPVVPLVLAGAARLGCRVLASLHGPARSEAAGPHVSLAPGAAMWKIARPCGRAEDVAAAIEEARDLAAKSATGGIPPAFVVPYGPVGAAARVLTSAIAEGAGCDPFVFGSGDVVASSGAGSGLALQPALAHLLDELRLGEVSGRARLYGLIGCPPVRSPSPRLHNAVFRAAGLDAIYLPAVDLDPVEAFRLPYAGFGVTTPWKEDAALRSDTLDSLAARIGAVNTVVRLPDGRLSGSNTDAEAVRDAAREAGVVSGGALVFGGGGFARAAAVALKDAGLTVRLVGSARAKHAADALGVQYAGNVPFLRSSDAAVVNATPLGADGTLPEPLAGLIEAIPLSAWIVDAPYGEGGRPGAFAVACRGEGVHVLDGPDLLLRQAAGQAVRFAGDAPQEGVLSMALAPKTNLVLVGIRGAGKTRVGRAVASLLGRPFVDTDFEVARRIGRPVGRVLSEVGEPAFRALERTEVLRAASRCGAVIAVGGGALTTTGNAEALAERGFVAVLAVTALEAARRIASDPAPRPRLTDAVDLADECARLLAERRPQYARVARHTISTDAKTVHAVAAEVAAVWVKARQDAPR